MKIETEDVLKKLKFVAPRRAGGSLSFLSTSLNPFFALLIASVASCGPASSADMQPPARDAAGKEDDLPASRDLASNDQAGVRGDAATIDLHVVLPDLGVLPDAADDLAVADLTIQGDFSVQCVEAGVGKAKNLSFAGSTDYLTGTVPSAVAIGDLNEDGAADVVVFNATGNMGSTVGVYYNFGNGILHDADVHKGGQGYSTAVVDLDGDGKMDILAGGSFLRGLGKGMFAAPVKLPSSGPSAWVVPIDMNGDGKIDLLTSDALDTKIYLAINKGGAKFAPDIVINTVAAGDYFSTGDLNGDGVPDIVGVEPGFTKLDVLVSTNNSGGYVDLWSGVNSGTQDTLVVDLDGDGASDVVTSDATEHRIQLWMNSGKGDVTLKGHADAGDLPAKMASADFNGDGKPDIAVATTNAVMVFLNVGGGAVAPGFRLPLVEQGDGVAVGDLNCDGKPDIAVTFFDNGKQPGGVAVFLNTSK